MHIPKHFEVTNPNEILPFIEQNGFGQIISTVNGRLCSTHAPFMLSQDKQTLLGHLAKVNPQTNTLEGQEVLITLQGEHDYISPSWYVNPGVPTWNYQAVHLYGRCHVFNDPDRLRELVATLTNKYESQYETSWLPNYPDAMLRAIVGIEIEINEIQAQFKLSQNRPAQDTERVIQVLEQQGPDKLAKAMRTQHPHHTT